MSHVGYADEFHLMTAFKQGGGHFFGMTDIDRLIIFAIATCYAALGGVLYVHFVRFSYPGTWIMMLSLQILGAVVIGGLRSIYGTVFGAFIIFAVPDMVLKPLVGNIDGLPYVFTGVLIILVVMFYPAGL